MYIYIYMCVCGGTVGFFINVKFYNLLCCYLAFGLYMFCHGSCETLISAIQIKLLYINSINSITRILFFGAMKVDKKMQIDEERFCFESKRCESQKSFTSLEFNAQNY